MQQIRISTNHFVLCQQLSDEQGKRTKPLFLLCTKPTAGDGKHGVRQQPQECCGNHRTVVGEARIEHLVSWQWRQTCLDYISHHAQCRNVIDSFSNFIFIKTCDSAPRKKYRVKLLCVI